MFDGKIKTQFLKKSNSKRLAYTRCTVQFHGLGHPNYLGHLKKNSCLSYTLVMCKGQVELIRTRHHTWPSRHFLNTQVCTQSIPRTDSAGQLSKNIKKKKASHKACLKELCL